MSIENAIRAVAASNLVAERAAAAWNANAASLNAAGANTARRIASIVGQCAHESGGFKVLLENMNYSTEGLMRVFRRHFASAAEAAQFAHQPERIANRVYANRNGNGNSASGDGWRYRGKGYLQLTGRANYRIFGAALNLNLEGQPELAAEPEAAWRIAVHYLATRIRSGRTLLQWADADDERMVTRGINGGDNGLADRLVKVGKALAAQSGATTVAEWQSLLLRAGFDPGPVDGLSGPRTRAALAAAEARFHLTGEPLADKLRSLA